MIYLAASHARLSSLQYIDLFMSHTVGWGGTIAEGPVVYITSASVADVVVAVWMPAVVLPALRLSGFIMTQLGTVRITSVTCLGWQRRVSAGCMNR